MVYTVREWQLKNGKWWVIKYYQFAYLDYYEIDYYID